VRLEENIFHFLYKIKCEKLSFVLKNIREYFTVESLLVALKLKNKSQITSLIQKMRFMTNLKALREFFEQYFHRQK
jgi:hypothetical protein